MTRRLPRGFVDELETVRRRNPEDLGPLFATMVRRSDPPTSALAAEAVAPNLTELQEKVLEAYRVHGPMTAKQVEQLPELKHLGFSTSRKRCSELLRMGQIEPTGAVVDRCAVYRVRAT